MDATATLTTQFYLICIIRKFTVNYLPFARHSIRDSLIQILDQILCACADISLSPPCLPILADFCTALKTKIRPVIVNNPPPPPLLTPNQ